MNSNGSLWVLIGLSASLCVFMDPYKSLWCLCVLINLYASFRVLIGPNGSL